MPPTKRLGFHIPMPGSVPLYLTSEPEFFSIPHPMLEIIFALLAFVIVFLLLREFFCWYWKINERISLLEQIKKSLEQIRANTVTKPPPEAPESRRELGS